MSPDRLAHAVAGTGEALLLLNGGMMTFASWEPIAGPLETSHRVVRCDLRGQLLSPGQPPESLDGHVADVVALLDSLGLGAAHVVGASFGALVGVRLAVGHPDRVRSLVAITATDRVDDALWRDTQPILEAAVEAAAGGDGARVYDLLVPHTFSPGYLDREREAIRTRRQQMGMLPRTWYADLVGLLRSLEGVDLRPDLGRIRCPVLVVAAEADRTFPPERSRALADGIPGARMVSVAGSGHGLVVEQPDRVLEILRTFVSGG